MDQLQPFALTDEMRFIGPWEPEFTRLYPNGDDGVGVWRKHRHQDLDGTCQH